MKKAILQALATQITEEVSILEAAALAAAKAAVHEESRAEDQHDTRSIEASYLAAGHAKRVEDLKRTLLILEQYVPREAHGSVIPGALVEAEQAGKKAYYFLCPFTGGQKVVVDQMTVTILSPTSALGERLMGTGVGDEVEVGRPPKTYTITEIR